MSFLFNKWLLLVIAVFSTCAPSSMLVDAKTCQLQPILQSPDGVAWNQNFCGAKATQLEVYLDLQCPDSRSTWRSLHSVLRQLDESGDQLCFLLYLFPLPYHSNSFLSALVCTGLMLVQSAHLAFHLVLSAFKKLAHHSASLSKEPLKWKAIILTNFPVRPIERVQVFEMCLISIGCAGRSSYR